MKCERLFANGTAIYEGEPAGHLSDGNRHGDAQAVLSNSMDHGKSIENQSDTALSPAVRALLKVAYPNRCMNFSGQRPADAVLLKLEDLNSYLWYGAVVDRTLIIYFDKSVIHRNMEVKAGLVAVMDLAYSCFDCQRAVVCIDKQLLLEQPYYIKHFHWMGFSLVRCPKYINGGQLSTAWAAMEVEL
ncbi:hypothetical protein V1514DRAFT_287843 [Lipomyces japonicus]|uniref:uncharacterized protein n=1 Tax=Lipomyces japonicus TaxID=56871 RepID=UPI0034CDFB30